MQTNKRAPRPEHRKRGFRASVSSSNNKLVTQKKLISYPKETLPLKTIKTARLHIKKKHLEHHQQTGKETRNKKDKHLEKVGK